MFKSVKKVLSSLYTKERFETHLHIHCRSNSYKEAKTFLEKSCVDSINQKSSITGGDTPIIIACRNNNYEMAELLLDNGADANQENDFNDTPLIISCCNGNLKLAELLLKNGAKESINNLGKDGDISLHIACRNNNYEMTKLLLDNGAKKSINEPSENGNTPLYQACRHDNYEMAKLLLDNGAIGNIKANKFGVTPLSWSCSNKNHKLTKLLLGNGAKENINHPDKDGNTPLHQACYKKSYEATFELMKTGLVTEKTLESCKKKFPNFFKTEDGKMIEEYFKQAQAVIILYMLRKRKHNVTNYFSKEFLPKPILNIICHFTAPDIVDYPGSNTCNKQIEPANLQKLEQS